MANKGNNGNPSGNSHQRAMEKAGLQAIGASLTERMPVATQPSPPIASIYRANRCNRRTS